MNKAAIGPHKIKAVKKTMKPKQEDLTDQYFYGEIYPPKISRNHRDMSNMDDLDIRHVIKEIIWPSQRTLEC